jgi:hypothetical protein
LKISISFYKKYGEETYTAGSTSSPTLHAKFVLPSLYLNWIILVTVVNSCAAMVALANLRTSAISYFLSFQDSYRGMGIYQYSHPTANPNPRSRNLLGNSIIGALTGIKAVISPKQDMMDETTVPMSAYARIAPPGPARAMVVPLPRKRPR